MLEFHFSNALGEKWTLKYHPIKQIAALTGEDIAWEECPVIEGVPLHLTITDDEKLWLEDKWNWICKQYGTPYLYRNPDLKLIVGKKHCELSDNHCLVCLEQKLETQIHHCIPRSYGGSDGVENLARICNSCHALISFGSLEEREPASDACYYHQLANFGYKFFPRLPRKKGTHKGRSIFDKRPELKEVLEYFDSLSEEQQSEADEFQKSLARKFYVFSRDYFLGRWKGTYEEFRSFKEKKNYFQKLL